MGRKIQKIFHKSKKEDSFWYLLWLGETGIKPLDWLSNKWGDLVSEYHSRKEMLGRMIFWGWKMRWNWDFDARTIYDILYYKLDGLYVCFRDHGNCDWNSSEDKKRMKKLRIARELARRLAKENYHTNLNMHDKKWGEGTTPLKIEKEKKLEEKEIMRAYKKDDLQKESEKRYLFMLIEKYIDRWWD